MSTRANVVIKDRYDTLWFYRHSDGYPEGTMPTLKILLNWLKSGKIRNNAQQCAGWLIVIGAIEYGTIPKFEQGEERLSGSKYGDIDTIQPPSDWKVGAYEPTTQEHGDIEYLYTIDVEKKFIEVQEVERHYNKDYSLNKTTYHNLENESVG
jgi:hypothetical protein